MRICKHDAKNWFIIIVMLLALAGLMTMFCGCALRGTNAVHGPEQKYVLHDTVQSDYLCGWRECHGCTCLHAPTFGFLEHAVKLDYPTAQKVLKEIRDGECAGYGSPKGDEYPIVIEEAR